MKTRNLLTLVEILRKEFVEETEIQNTTYEWYSGLCNVINLLLYHGIITAREKWMLNDFIYDNTKRNK